ncbi:hypothetical protein ATO6_12160 [Oceanicola sp. 22II-s10i]|uniref:DUF2194 domain-containing protein n=1 Tax=Oceanicola sp. 22II-s10i TaxID=1317116 RepID=UPI000B528655|nr:DUF2194 domain-containing protein [Oceanicola sp. 22II-s10i]OWU84448.1 hypothetical protein ATO6_12160 [Oceanicola sp. 22II-s10i]
MDETRSAERILVIAHSQEQVSRLAWQNVREAMRCARVSFDQADLASSGDLPELLQYSAVLMVTESLDRLSTGAVSALEDFVDDGGGLVVAFRARHPRLNALFGVVGSEAYIASIPPSHPSGGLRFPGRALPSFEGIHLPEADMIPHSGFDIRPVPSAEIVATATSGKPVAWRTVTGRGAVIFWNTAFLAERRARGLIIESVQAVEAVSVQPIANVAVVQIDDFPAPLGGNLSSDLMARHDMTDPGTFYARVWYPDVVRIAQRHGIGLSCFAVFNYHVERDKQLEAAPRAESFDVISEIAPAEIGLHGFDHRSLRLADWSNEAAMRTSLGAVRTAWSASGLGESPVCYVPPNNVYDAYGARCLASELPSLRVLSGSFFGDVENGQGREFGPEPWAPSLYCLPRVTAGHECSDETLFDAASQIATMGVWTHFIHPDDVADTPGPNARKIGLRNPEDRPWHSTDREGGLLGQLDAIFKAVRRLAPWLRFVSTREAADAVKAHLERSWQVGQAGADLDIRGPVGGWTRLRLNHRPWRRIETAVGCEIVHRTVAEDYTLYVLRFSAEQARLRLIDRSRLASLAAQLWRRGQTMSDRKRPSPAALTSASKSP